MDEMKRGPGRPPRQEEQRAFEGRAQSERENHWPEVIELEANAGTFPPVPKDPNWHYCWVQIPTDLLPNATNAISLMNGQAKFMPVNPSEVPGMDHLKATSGVVQGEVIQFMDTILCRTEQGRWEAIMRGEAQKAQRQLGLTRVAQQQQRGINKVEHERVTESAGTFA